MRTRISFFALVLGCAAVAYACSESTDGVVPDGGSSGSPDPSGDGGGSSSDGSTNSPSDSSTTGNDTGPPITASAVVLNEISGDDEWGELVNGGTTAVDVSGFKVADSEKDGGAPKLDEAVTLPAGTILSPKSYAIVKGGGFDAGVGKKCPDGGQSFCFNAEFGISNKNGETIYLVDTTGKVVGSAVYPPNAAPSGETWGRIPSGAPDGVFVLNVATPGAANVAK